MTPREAEKLLGGYATETLTDAERRALFAAALEDQALFDALTDEEALRALLADPDVRARLLAAMGKPVVPFWRRPAIMGLAASLLLAVGAGVVLRHVPAPEPARMPPTPPSGEKVQATPAQAPPALKTAKRVPHAEPRAPELLQSEPPSVPAAPPAANVMSGAEMGVPSPIAEAAPTPVGQAEGAAGGVRANAEAKRSAEMAASHARFADSAKGLSLNRESLAPPSPSWSFEPAPAGQFSLKVLWGPQGHLYLLHRDQGGASVLAPISMAAQPDGKTASHFRGSVGTQDKLDLYLLPEAAATPASLPAEGPVPGFRARVWPEEKKAP